MLIHAISDTHGKHGFVDHMTCDMVIHAGDISTCREPIKNAQVVRDFIEWYKNYPATYKVCIAGNHDTSIEMNYVLKEEFTSAGIILLQHETQQIGGLKIFGSPYTPTFGNGWAYNRNRAKLFDYWQDIEEDTDIVVTHGPAKGILDYTEYGNTELEKTFKQCGCKALLHRIKKIEPKYHIFGHIHPERECPNNGVLKLRDCDTTFINAAVLDLQYKSHNNGYLFTF